MNVERGKFESEPTAEEAELDARIVVAAEAAMKDPRYAPRFARERGSTDRPRGSRHGSRPHIR